MPFVWHDNGMTVTIDRTGRIVIPALVRERLGIQPGAQFELSVEDGGIRLAPTTPPPRLVTRNGRLIARPAAPREDLPVVDVAALIEEERNRWP
jgi:AbrB family looped-hinge helix DNA binding protein